MCRSIKPLFKSEPEVTTEDVRAAALQYVRKISGMRAPSRVNEAVFNQAIEEITKASEKMLRTLIKTKRPVQKPTQLIG